MLLWTSKQSLLVVLAVVGCKDYHKTIPEEDASDWVLELTLEGAVSGHATSATISCAETAPYFTAIPIVEACCRA